MTLEEMVGQQLMIGISGSKVSPETVKLFKETHAGSLIIFRPNFESAKQFRQLIFDLEQKIGRQLLIAVDHEGGRVIHVSEGITAFPDNLVLGQTQNENYAKQQGEIEARELKRLWIDINLSPTLDVLTENFSPNIGIRSYGKNPELVARLGSARIKGIQNNGVSACAKHFPGQGQSSIDAHLGLPVLPTTWEEMKRVHIKPFIAAIQSGVDCVMSSHPMYPNLDSEKTPATFSRRIIHDYLREELGFKGAILTDDLEMGALKNLCSIGEAAVRAVSAGHDMVLVCHDAAAIREVNKSLLTAYQQQVLKISELEKSVKRIQALKKNRPIDAIPSPEPGGKGLATCIARDAIHSLNSFDGSVSVIFPKLSELADKIFIEKNMLDEAAFVRGLFNGRLNQSLIVGINPSDSDIEHAQNLAEGGDSIVFFCFDAHLSPQTQKLLEMIQVKSKRCSVVLMRDPYDRKFIRDGIDCVDSYGFRSVQLESVIR